MPRMQPPQPQLRARGDRQPRGTAIPGAPGPWAGLPIGGCFGPRTPGGAVPARPELQALFRQHYHRTVNKSDLRAVHPYLNSRSQPDRAPRRPRPAPPGPVRR
jgi:hypothetical protein